MTEETTPTAEEPKAKKRSAPSGSAPNKARAAASKQWSKIEALWESGNVEYADLVEKFGRTASAYGAHFRRNGIVKGSKKELVKEKVTEQVVKAQVDEAVIIAARIRETKEDHYKMAASLGKLTWAEILAARGADGKGNVASALPNLKALDAAASILKKVREERYSVLGLDRTDAVHTDELPELFISELTDEQVKALRDRDHTELDHVSEGGDDPASSPDDEDIEEGED